jgi:predicted nucleic acid-binding protein
MAKALIDTGPLVAWLDKGDGDHPRVAGFLGGFDGQLLSTWPVLTEVCHLLPRHVVGRFMRWVSAGGLSILEMPQVAVDDIAGLMEKNDDLPMDLADASLLWFAANLGVGEVITLDQRDFGVYRLPGGDRLRNLLES